MSDSRYIALTVIVTFYLTRAEKIMIFFAKRMLTSIKLREPWYVLKGLFSETTYACLLTYQKSSF